MSILQYHDPEKFNCLCHRKFENLCTQKLKQKAIFKEIDNYIFDNKEQTDEKFRKIFTLLLKNCVEEKFIKNFPKFLSIKSELFLNLNKNYMVDFLSEDGIEKIKIAKNLNLANLKKIEKIKSQTENENEFNKIIDFASKVIKKKNNFSKNSTLINQLLSKNFSDEDLKKVKNFINSLNENIIENKKEKEKTYKSPEFIFRHSITSSYEFRSWFEIRNYPIPDDEPEEEIYRYLENCKNRAVNNVINFLKKNNNYDFSQFGSHSRNQYFLRDVFKNGREIIIFVRCTDFGWFQIGKTNQVNVLKKNNCECWGDNGVNDPEIINIGTIIERNGLFNTKINLI